MDRRLPCLTLLFTSACGSYSYVPPPRLPNNTAAHDLAVEDGGLSFGNYSVRRVRRGTKHTLFLGVRGGAASGTASHSARDLRFHVHGGDWEYRVDCVQGYDEEGWWQTLDCEIEGSGTDSPSVLEFRYGEGRGGTIGGEPLQVIAQRGGRASSLGYDIYGGDGPVGGIDMASRPRRVLVAPAARDVSRRVVLVAACLLVAGS